MKKTLLSVFASGIVLMACGQNPTPPKEVQTAFTKKFSSAQELKWEQEKNEWEAEFKLNGVEMSASFDNSGKWMETESEVKKEDVPAQVFKSIALKFNGFEIDEIEKVETNEFNGYEIELEKEETEVEILCTTEGVITIKKVEVEDDDDDD
jgi:hypothetical protein